MYYSLFAAACFVASASAHATFQDLWINGVDAGSSCVRLPLSNNPGKRNVFYTPSTLLIFIFRRQQ